MKTFIVDDERLARIELLGLLEEHPEIEVVGEAATVTEALRLIPSLKPELIFLDIEMPGRTGFDLLAALPPPHPRCVFVTAYDAFALRAFEVNAFDYLVKPVLPARLAETLARVRSAKPSSEIDPDQNGSNDATGPLRVDDQVFVRDGERCWFVLVAELCLLEAEGNHTRLHFRKEQALLYRTLGAIEERLPASLFFRANRGQLINRTFIERVEPWFGGTLKVVLRGGREIELSRRRAQVFRERMGL